MAETPTGAAEMYFSAVVGNSMSATTTNKFEPRDLAYALMKMSEGLGQMAIGLRATYILLEEVKELVRRQNAQLAGRP